MPRLPMLREDVAFLLVLAHVETHPLFLLADAQADGGVDHEQYDDGRHDAENPSDHDGQDLTSHDAAAFNQTQLTAFGNVPGSARRKHTRENGAQRTAHAVNAEGIQGVV